MQGVDISFCILEGITPSKLLDYLTTNTTNGILTFSSKGIKYNELIGQADNAKKANGLYLKNVCEIDGSKLMGYIYNIPEPEYNICFVVKTFKQILKGTRKKDQVHIYKMTGDPCVYVRIVKAETADQQGTVSFLKPLKMEDQNFYRFPDNNSAEEDSPNCTAIPSVFKKECSKISPTNYKDVTISCQNNHIEIKAISPDGTDGHIISYGVTSAIPKLEVNLDKLQLDFSKIFSDDLMLAPVSVNILKNDAPLNITISARAFKNLVKISQLSDEPIKFIFGDGYIKIVTMVGNFGVLRTYVSNE